MDRTFHARPDLNVQGCWIVRYNRQPPESENMIRYYNAYVRSGRLVLNEPATDLPDLPEGTRIELVWVEDIRNGGDLFEAAEQAALRRELDASIAEADAGQTVDVAEVLAELRARHQESSQSRVITEAARPFDIASTLDDMRLRLAQAAAVAHAKVDLFNQSAPTEDDEARRRREIFAHLIQATAEVIDETLEAADQLAAELATRPASTRTT